MRINLVNKLRIVVVLAGFATMELEIIGTRILSPIFGPTIYVWTSMIGVTLTFLALGYWYGGKLVDEGKIAMNALGAVILLLGVWICILPHISKPVLFQLSDWGILWGPLVASLMILSFPVFFSGFVVPSAVKLITQSLEEVGSRAGEIYSLATVGSIIGTFTTGFFLVLYLGVAKTCLITGIALILLSLIVIEPKIKFLSILIVILLIMSPTTTPPEILESFDSPYGQIRVRDTNRAIVLYMDGIIETMLNKETQESGTLNTFLFNVPFVYNSSYKKVLMIGLAGGLGAKELAQRYDVDLDVVEIEPRMLDVAEEHFGWAGERRVHFDDGRHFLRNSGKYDVIIVDTGVIFCCWHLYTLEAFQEVYDHLNPDGVFLVNFIASTEGGYSMAAQSEYETLKRVFDDVLIIRGIGDPEDACLVTLLASKKKIDRDKLLESTKRSGLSRGPLSLGEIINASFEISFDNERVGLTTDDHPIAEFYDYIVWQKIGKIGKGGLKYFMPGG